MRRRHFITMLSGAAISWPFFARAQQAPRPAIGFLGATSPGAYTIRLGAFHQGLKEAGYVEGQNVAIEYRWADLQYERLSALATELVEHRVAVIAAGGGTPSALAAKAATSTIPIVFETAADPVKLGLVASLNRPGGNLTGVTNENAEVGPKRLAILRELMPTAAAIAVLVNPTNALLTEQFLNGMQPASRALGMQLHIVQAKTEGDFDQAFATMAQLRVDALVIAPDQLFNSRPEQLTARALRQALPTIHQYREFVATGGLVSYGASETEFYRLVGSQVGKILNGAKPAELPVQQSTKIELIINLKTAKALGLTVPQSLLARADEVIE